VFAKEDRARMSRKELYKNSLKKAGMLGRSFWRRV
jgi:hypothetical protein